MLIVAFGLGIIVGMMSWLGLAAWLEAGRETACMGWKGDAFERLALRRKIGADS